MATVTVTARDQAGNSRQAAVTYTLSTTPEPPTGTMLMGCSASNNDHGGTEQWDVWRCYTEGSMLNLANRTGNLRPKALAYSKDGPNLGGSNPSVASVKSEVLADLNAFYYTGGATSQTRSSRWGIKLYWSNGNENHDKGALSPAPAVDSGHTATQIAAYGRSMQGLYEAIHTIDPATGQRRFPDAYAGSNPTTEAERNGWCAGFLGQTAQWHDFVMWSMYPRGRKETVEDPTYNWPSFNDADYNASPEGWLVRCYRRTKAAGIGMISIGETGIGDSPGDPNARPYYVVHGLAHAFQRLADQYDLEIPYACWWDNELSGGPQNILTDEPTTTSPSTREAWQNWRSYCHLRGGTHPASWAGKPGNIRKQTDSPPTS